MSLKRFLTVLLCLNEVLATPAKSVKSEAGSDIKKSVEIDHFWNKTVSELFGPKAADCKNQVFPLKNLFPSQKEFQEDFSECRTDITSDSEAVFDKLCLSALFNMQYVCSHIVKSENRSISVSEIDSFVAEDLCTEVMKSAVPIPNCHDVKACNVSLLIAFQFKNASKPLCDACMKTQNSKNVCRYLLFTYKAIDILDKYGNSGPEVRKPELEVQRPEPDTEKKEEVNPGQDQSNIVDAEIEVPQKLEGGQDEKSVTDKKEDKPQVQDEQNVEDSMVPTIAEADRANVVTDPVVIAEASTSKSQQKSTDRGNDTKNASDIIPDQPDSLTGVGADDDDDDDVNGEPEGKVEKIENAAGGDNQIESKLNQDTENLLVDHLSNPMRNAEEASNYLNYLLLVSVVAIVAYLVFHNKQKILALILEGRRGRKSSGRRRTSSSARYRKLDNNLEEAMGPGSDDSARHVIY